MKKTGHIVLCFFLLLSCSNEKSNLSVLPSDWIQLTTSENGELTIFNSCDNGNRKLKIEKLIHGISLQTYGEQEDNNFTVNSSSWVGDTLKILGLWNDSKLESLCKFYWFNNDKKIAKWDLVDRNSLYTTFTKKNQFKIINQPCNECWDDDDCN